MKNLLKYFHDLTIHPKNAAELKGLILQLAVQGKLTVNWRLENPDVEPASVLLERIQAEKVRLVKEKKIKKEKPLPEIITDEVPYELPKIWEWSRLGEISQIIGGGTPKSNISEYFTENGIPWFTPADLGKQKGKFITRGKRDVTELGLKKSSAQLMPAGSVLFSSRAPIGHTAIIVKDSCTNQGFKSSAPIILEMNEFIYHYLNSIVNDVNEKASGTTFKEVSGTIVKNFLFPLPPLEEQKAIVSVVNQLFAEVEQLETLTKERIQLKADFVASALQQLTNSEKINGEWAFLQQHFATFFTELPNIKKLRESILQLAVQGKLTTHWRSRHPELVSGSHSAEALLERVKTEKAQLVKAGKIKKEKPLPKISAEEIPYELPESWVWCRFHKIIVDIEAGKSPKCRPEIAEKDEWGVIKMSAISWGVFDEMENKALTLETEPFTDKEIKPGDFILTRANTDELIAKSVIVHDGIRSKLLLNDKTLRFKFASSISSQYINLYNNGNIARNHYKRVSSGTSDSMRNISRENIKMLTIPLPPLEEQKAIVEKVNTLMALCDQLEQEIQTSQSTREDWMKSSLREVFAEAKPKAETKVMDLDRGELGMVAEPESKYNR